MIRDVDCCMARFSNRSASSIRTALQLTAAIAALLPAAAFAQDAAPAGPATTAAAKPSPGEQSDGDQPVNLGDIVVTANRRAERLQNVPIAITSLTPTDLVKASITDSAELVHVTPGLRMDGTGIFSSPTIRGVSTNQASAASDPNVATYIDGVYQQFTVGAIFALADVSQIQVLKGPQGTLFGRNATGGAILISTRDPNLSEAEGSIDLSYGRFNEVIAKAFVSGPIVKDVLGASLSGYVNRYDGFYHNVANGQTTGGLQDYLLRGKIRFQPADGIDLVATGIYSNRRDEDVNKPYSMNGSNPNLGIPGSVVGDRPFTYASDFDPLLTTKTLSGSLRGTFEIGPGTLSSTTAYTKVKAPLTYDFDQTNLALSQGFENPLSKTFTQELVYSTDRIGGVQGTFGGFYYNSKASFDVFVNDDAFVIISDDRAKAYALFGEVNYEITDRLKLVAGLRYSSEKRSVEASGFSFGTQIAALARQQKTFHSVTPRASIIYKITPNNNVYFTYSKGFKSGLFNSNAFQVEPIQPEKLTSYEAGTKNSFGAFSINLSGFYYDYQDLQVSNLVRNGNSFIAIVNNAASSRIYGGELEAAYRPSRDLSLSAGVSYLHARYKKFPSASVIVPVGTFTDSGLPAIGPGACNFANITPSGLGGQSVSCDASGNRLIRAPEWSGNVTASYSVHAGDGLINLSASTYFTTKIYYDAINRVKQPAYAMANARIGWQPFEGDEFEVALWGKNLTNRHVIASEFESELGDLTGTEMPRTYGVQLRYSF